MKNKLLAGIDFTSLVTKIDKCISDVNLTETLVNKKAPSPTSVNIITLNPESVVSSITDLEQRVDDLIDRVKLLVNSTSCMSQSKMLDEGKMEDYNNIK